MVEPRELMIIYRRVAENAVADTKRFLEYFILEEETDRFTILIVVNDSRIMK